MELSLELRGISKSYQRGSQAVAALEHVSLAVHAGEFVAISGSSGCGKTTLLLIAGGLLSPTNGQVLVNGQHPYELAPEPRAIFRARNVGFIFQQFHLVPYLTVLENVMAPAVATGLQAARGRANELIERCGLGHRRTHLPAELSTGERQRTAIARALLNRPKLLLADEPTGNLDQDNAATVLQHLSDFAAEGGAVLLVSHDPQVSRKVQRMVRMESGRLLT